MPATVDDPELRSRLNLAKLRALVREHTGEEDWEPAPPAAVAAVTRGRDCYVLVTSTEGLGAALIFAARRAEDRSARAATLTVVADRDADAAVLARRAQEFRRAPLVLKATGRSLSAVEPAAQRPPRPAQASALETVEALRRQGADVVVEHGVVIAEVRGLEVGRVVPDAGGGWILEVGVGKHDRAATAIMEAVRDAGEVRRSVIDVVDLQRRPEASPHLLNRLARQRWLRAQLLADPSLVQARTLTAMEAPLPRESIVDPAPAIAAGHAADGTALVVACSVGVDLDLVPTAADARARHDPHAELVIVTPPRDQYPVLRTLAAALTVPARLVALAGDWPA